MSGGVLRAAVRPRLRPRALRSLVLLVALATTLGVAEATWWLTHPDALEPVGTTVRSEVQVGEDLAVSLLVPERPVRVREIEPVGPGTDDVDHHILAVSGCRHVPGHGRDVDLRDLCRRVAPAQGTVISPVEHDPHEAFWLVAVLRPRRPGTHRVDGFVVRYRDGVRVGAELTGTAVELHAR